MKQAPFEKWQVESIINPYLSCLGSHVTGAVLTLKNPEGRPSRNRLLAYYLLRWLIIIQSETR